ncbi:uncharacterized protein LOC128229321 [Mya arenaria]|uniref:uncharacterized protein LOC128229321 n=1 Tax=Mya arenaria TaxID=6604 RepID=UPI0022E7C8BB|nr:uncharacterized protein LOC128229321 [Mya arenaria]
MGNNKSKGGRGETSKVEDETLKEVEKEVNDWSQTIKSIKKNQGGEGTNICEGDLYRRMTNTARKINDYMSNEVKTGEAGLHSSEHVKLKHEIGPWNPTSSFKRTLSEDGACSSQDREENVNPRYLIAQIEFLKADRDKMRNSIKRLKEDISKQNISDVNEKQVNASPIDNKNKTKQQLKQTEEGLRQENARLSDELESQYTIIQTLQQDVRKRLDEQAHTHRANIRDLQAENDQLRMRLSKLAGDKLTKDNPNIADLSDRNRPTKLGEMYSELYDNEWTDAFEGLTKGGGYKDEEAIKALRKTLDSAYTFCVRNSNELVAKMEAVAEELFEDITRRWHSLTLPQSPLGRVTNPLLALEDHFIERHWKPKQRKEAQTDWNRQTLVPPTHMGQELIKMRKGVAVSMVPVVQHAYLRDRWDKECIKSLKPFIKKSLFICWMMVVQTPPMVFDSTTKPDLRFDALLYRQYTASGDTIEYVVWPAMLLHEKGPLVLKGVAQPKKRV